MTDLTADDLDLEETPPAIPAASPDPPHPVDPETGEITFSALEEVRRDREALGALEEALVSVLGALEIPSVARATPAERAAIVDLYWTLSNAARTLGHRARAIEHSWRHAFEQLGATKLPLPDGRFVVYAPPPADYAVDGPTLRRELLALAERGFLTLPEVDEAIAPVVTYRANHTKLNAFVRRGTDVAEVIESCRTKNPPAAMAGRVNFPPPRAREIEP